MVSLYLCSSGSNARGESRAEEGAVSAQNALRGSETETRELLGGTERKSVSPQRVHRVGYLSGHLACALPDVSRRKEAYQKRASQTFKSLLPHTRRFSSCFYVIHRLLNLPIKTLSFRKLFLQSFKSSRNAQSLLIYKDIII